MRLRATYTLFSVCLHLSTMIFSCNLKSILQIVCGECNVLPYANEFVSDVQNLHNQYAHIRPSTQLVPHEQSDQTRTHNILVKSDFMKQKLKIALKDEESYQ